MHAPVPGRVRCDAAHLGDPGAELGEEDLAGHGDGQLAPLHGLGTFVGGFELRVHPLVGEEAGAVFGDAVAAHQAHGFAHHVGAVAGVPQLGRGAEHVGLGVLEDEVHEGIGLEFSAAWIVRAKQPAVAIARLFAFAQCLLFRAAALNTAIFQDRGSSAFRSGRVRRSRRAAAKSKRCSSLAGGPHVDQAMQRIFALLDALLVAHRCRASRLRLRGTGRAGSE